MSGQETILLVEDEPSVGSLIRKVLEARGYRILQAHDSMNAFEIGEAHPGRIDLLISDVIMSGLNGPELAARLKRRRPAMKVLYISGFVDHTAVDLANLSENGMFMQKPFTPDALAARIRQQLDSTTGPNG